MYLKIILFSASTLLLCNCTSTIQSRIDGNPKMFAALTGTQKNAVSNGRILKGMTMDAVYLSWGRPDGIKESTINGKDVEKWRYSSHMPILNQNIIYSNHHYYHHDTYTSQTNQHHIFSAMNSVCHAVWVTTDVTRAVDRPGVFFAWAFESL